ncbi:MAG: hypothetical protein GY811_16605 [Myxococcales bacterium]|nr:hypothetical protein [Myxococcales bacterium]
MRAFISTYDGLESPEGRALTRNLTEVGCEIEFSPSSPHSGSDDPRWPSWHSEGLPAAIGRADIFIALIPDSSVYSSTWMASEFDEAFRRFQDHGSPKLYIYQSDPAVLPAGFASYVSASERLPSDPTAAAQVVGAGSAPPG